MNLKLFPHKLSNFFQLNQVPGTADGPLDEGDVLGVGVGRGPEGEGRPGAAQQVVNHDQVTLEALLAHLGVLADGESREGTNNESSLISQAQS